MYIVCITYCSWLFLSICIYAHTTYYQVLNFYNESFAIYELVTNGESDLLSRKLNILEWQVCNIKKFAGKIRPKRVIFEGLAERTREQRRDNGPPQQSLASVPAMHLQASQKLLMRFELAQTGKAQRYSKPETATFLEEITKFLTFVQLRYN